MGDWELMKKWRKRAMDRLVLLREVELQLQKLEEQNAFLIIESQRHAANARIWEHRYKSMALNKIPGCGEV